MIDGTEEIIGVGVGAGEDMTVGDGGNEGTEDGVDDNADDAADGDVALTWERVARAGPITCRTKEIGFVGKQADESANAKECVNCVTDT